jgi:hypothetical protein
MQIAPASRQNPIGKTAAIPVPRGQTVPPFPPAEVQHPEEWAKIPGIKIVDHDHITPGPNPSIYAYVKAAIHANLFRIPLQ